MPVIALPTMKAFMEGAAAVRAVPMANSTLEKSRIFLLLNHTSNFPLSKIFVTSSRKWCEDQTRLTTVGTNHPCPMSR